MWSRSLETREIKWLEQRQWKRLQQTIEDCFLYLIRCLYSVDNWHAMWQHFYPETRYLQSIVSAASCDIYRVLF